MLKNYLKVALRNLWKNKTFSAINILGLAIGMGTCLLIVLFVLDELSFDKFNKKSDRIYRVDADLRFGGAEQKFAVNNAPLAFTMVKEYPQVENAVRFRNYGPSVVKKGNQNIKEERIIYTDSTLFDVFTLPMIAGDPTKALTAPKSVVITESIAKKYFGKTDVVGQSLLFDNKDLYSITGVIKEVPENSHFRFDFFISLAGDAASKEDNWLSFNFNTYLLLKPGVEQKIIQAKFDEVLQKHLWPQAEAIMHTRQDDFKKSGNYMHFKLTPLTDIHLQSDRIAELAPNSSLQTVYIFSAIAIFILLIACVNFMNLSTARSANRAKEVGVRKVLGTQRSNLIKQFLTESVVMSLIAFVIALLFCLLTMPLLNQLAAKQFTLSPIVHPYLLPILLGFAVVVGLIAGSYPAFYLSAFKPIEVLKGKLSTGFKSSYFRSSLVVFQFFISIFLIIGTIVIYRQLNYIQNKKLGFNKEQVLLIKDTYVLDKKIQAFKDEALRQPGVISASISGFLPVPSSRNDSPLFPEGEINNDKAVSMQQWEVDHDYINTLGMEIIKGRKFSKEFATDSTGIILNESAVKLFGYQDPIGKKVSRMMDSEGKILKSYTVIGVVKNFHFASLRENIGALGMFLDRSTGAVSLRLQTNNVGSTIKSIESLWKKMAPGEAFTYSFLNEDFNNMYRSEQRVGRIFIAFAILALFIACLGLLGLATYAAEQRTKEIGIRKVLGATVSNIAGMLSKDFLKLVVVAAVITFPVAWWAMSKWLQDFAYRTSISWWIFVLAAIVAVVIALVTVCVQAIKAAISNPIKNLRTE
ncbi:ABC transporter permease [Segetibacter aerophilus]|uniref:ABC transporter permease n=1 Tax=Segetibacter aerophilus TaxID=670293 RepID=A0A512BB69_9BACT|nr:ABC transporter permease [Segetibacter aerophilus]GEO09224.1 ABC transporter permease [Segetibacter aerophilus]